MAEGDAPLPDSDPMIHGTCFYGHHRHAADEIWVTVKVWTDWASRAVTFCGWKCAVKYLVETPT